MKRERNFIRPVRTEGVACRIAGALIGRATPEPNASATVPARSRKAGRPAPRISLSPELGVLFIVYFLKSLKEKVPLRTGPVPFEWPGTGAPVPEGVLKTHIKVLLQFSFLNVNGTYFSTSPSAILL